MKVGTKSVLFGVHCPLIHTFTVALAWWKLYGFPWDPRLWIAFFVHDLGYWECDNMDGKQGVRHPELGANIMGRLFGRYWYYMTLLHSRGYAREIGLLPSKLCAADKLSIRYELPWFYLLRANLSGEIKEYMADAEGVLDNLTQLRWFKAVRRHFVEWAKNNK